MGDILTVFLSVLVGTFSLGQALPEIETFAGALGSAAYVFRIIDRVGCNVKIIGRVCYNDNFVYISQFG